MRSWTSGRRGQSTAELYFEASPEAIYIVQDGRYVDCNPATLRLFGRTREEFIGRDSCCFPLPLGHFEDGFEAI